MSPASIEAKIKCSMGKRIECLRKGTTRQDLCSHTSRLKVGHAYIHGPKVADKFLEIFVSVSNSVPEDSFSALVDGGSVRRDIGAVYTTLSTIEAPTHTISRSGLLFPFTGDLWPAAA